MIEYRLISETVPHYDTPTNTYRVEFRGEGADAVQAAWDDLQGFRVPRNGVGTLADGRQMRIDVHSPRWRAILRTIVRPAHADLVTGEWTYVDAGWLPLQLVAGTMLRPRFLSSEETEAAVAAMLEAHRTVLGIYERAVSLTHHCVTRGCRTKVSGPGRMCRMCQHDSR